MNKWARIIILFSTNGIVWCCSMRLLFIYSGAQQILADPARQSSKFLKSFIEYEPLPRMAGDGSIVWKGFFVCGLLAAAAFMIVNSKLSSGWLKRGLTFGFVHWALMIPWFEFYLPYNVMNEPLTLVFLEVFLWLVTILLTACYMSFVINFRRTTY